MSIIYAPVGHEGYSHLLTTPFAPRPSPSPSLAQDKHSVTEMTDPSIASRSLQCVLVPSPVPMLPTPHT